MIVATGCSPTNEAGKWGETNINWTVGSQPPLDTLALALRLCRVALETAETLACHPERLREFAGTAFSGPWAVGVPYAGDLAMADSLSA